MEPSLHADAPDAIDADDLKTLAKEWGMERVLRILALLLEVLKLVPWAQLDASAITLPKKKPKGAKLRFICGHCGLE
jgi:hypothetical protein